nr:deoxyribonuclease IV [Candidatus Freyrarchaeum guaymaensis]
MDRLRFGPAGIPLALKKNRTTDEGVRMVAELGLDAMEIEFVYGVRMSVDAAAGVRRVAEEKDVALTAHGPYYINLNSREKEKVEASVKRILDTARVAYAAGASSITFHAATYMRDPPEKVYDRVKACLERIVKTLKDEDVSVWVRPETTGKGSQFGSLQELVQLSKEVEMVLPCVDFAHIHARTGGKYNSREEFSEILSYLESELGRECLDNMHIHVSGIEYTGKGEKNHVNLEESDMRYVELVEVWKEFNVKGVVISESPNLEGDALLLKKIYRER